MKILVIDDDNFFRQFYTAKLSETGFDVESASDGEEGFTKIKKIIPDVILLDIVMPKKDGFSLLGDLAKDPVLQKIPVLVFSSLNQQDDLARIKQLGARGYINKSVQDFDSLLAKVFEVGNIHK